jgi:predicted NBD/HSP70 family sugar kinase
MSTVLCIDIGGTGVKYACMKDAAVLSRGEVKTPTEGLEALLQCLTGIFGSCLEKPEGIALSAPGRIDPVTSVFHTGGALTYVHELDLCALLKERCGVRVSAENDGKAAALAELWKGSMQNVRQGAVITLGTALGGGIIIDHHLYRGANGAAGEFSTMLSHLDCAFDGRVWAFENSVRTLTGMYAKKAGLPAAEVDGRLFFERAEAGDADALAALDVYCGTLISGLFSLQSILDCERIALGGGISRRPLLIETAQRKMEELFERLPSYAAVQKPEITACTFGNDANLFGALYHYLYEAGIREDTAC